MAAAPASATYPGRNGPIAFSTYGSSATEDGGDATSRLVVKRFIGSQEHVLLSCFAPGGDFDTAGCAISGFGSPSYSPDGSKIVFDAGERLAIVDADGSHLQPLPAASSDDGDPAFTANGRRIVFTGHDESGVPSVYERLADGAPARLLVTNASDPVVSSGKRLAFVRGGVVFVTDARGEHAHRVIAGSSPDWAPGGGRLVVVRQLRRVAPAGTGGLFVVRADGSHVRRVGKVKDAWHPAWSPDGRPRRAAPVRAVAVRRDGHDRVLDPRLEAVEEVAFAAQGLTVLRPNVNQSRFSVSKMTGSSR